MLKLDNKTVTIIGAKRSGLALANLVSRLNGSAKISHTQSVGAIAQEDLVQLSQQNVSLEHDGHTKEFIVQSDYLVLSPGVRHDAQVVQWAKQEKIPVFGEIEFAFQFCPKPIIAVTGSNGKTTVVTLINSLLEKAGYQSRLCGNVGFPFSKYCLDLTDCDYVVLELSSFQLESMWTHAELKHSSDQVKGFKPFIAILLNFSQNHLDRHEDLDEYFQAKARLFDNQTVADHAILNYTDPRIRDLSLTLKSEVHYFNKDKRSERWSDLNPNYLAVQKVADILNISDQTFKDVLDAFCGVEHRLELVRTLKGVDYINDSKATTAEAGRWALTQMQQPVIMICGGRDKNIDFSVLKDLVEKKVKKMFVIGEARTKIKSVFDGLTGVEECERLDIAVEKANAQAHAGDCVLLSPMCTSFDMFRDFEERGKVYKDIVNEL